MTARCPERKGAAGSLSCCRAAGHAATGEDPAGHCWHWSARLHGTPAHTLVVRAAGGHPVVCTVGAQLDGGL